MAKNKHASRNGTISLLKFIFSILILMYHIGKVAIGTHRFMVITVGYIAVDFFFIVSGYYFYNSILKIDKKENIYHWNLKKTLNRLIKFLPYTIIIYLIGSVLLFINDKIAINEIFQAIFNTSLLDMSGLYGYTLNGPLWYLSAMIIVFFALTPVIYNNLDKYSYYIAPITILFGIGYLYHQSESLNIFLTGWNNIIYSGLIRALVDINIGIIVYELSIKLSINIKENKYKTILLNFIQITLYILLFTYILFYHHEGRMDYIALIIIVIATITSFTDRHINKLLDTRIVRYLEKLSLPVFINHFVIIIILNIYLKPNSKYIITFSLCIIVTLLFSIIEMLVVEKLIDKIKTILQKRDNTI